MKKYEIITVDFPLNKNSGYSFRKEPDGSVTRGANVELQVLPIGLPSDGNPRCVRQSSEVFQAILKSIDNREPISYSQGLLVIASKAGLLWERDKRGVKLWPKAIRVSLRKGTNDGICDGNHLYTAIAKYITTILKRASLDSSYHDSIHIEFRTGLTEEQEIRLISVRNTHVSVTQESIFHRMGGLLPLKKAISPFEKTIAWKDNEHKNDNVPAGGLHCQRDLLTMMYILFFDFMPDSQRSEVPLHRARRLKKKTSKFYRNHLELFLPHQHFVKEAMSLYDWIRLTLADLGSEMFPKDSLLVRTAQKQHTFPFYPVGPTYRTKFLHAELSYAILAAVRRVFLEKGREEAQTLVAERTRTILQYLQELEGKFTPTGTTRQEISKRIEVWNAISTILNVRGSATVEAPAVVVPN